MTPCIAITPGEPAGIGPDLCIQIAQQAHDYALTLIADPELIQQRADMLDLPITLIERNQNNLSDTLPAGSIGILPVHCKTAVTAGQLNVENSAYVLQTLQTACELTQHGQFHAMVTAPVHKGIINESGIAFSGHTEFLADQTGSPLPVMMLATEGLRVALVTTHLPLKDIAENITQSRVEKILNILISDLDKWFGIRQAHILISGLNPHAGEDGHLGTEEIEHIIPAIEHIQNRFPDAKLTGPLPADTLFTPHHLKNVDAVLTMYHDQGLPVLKYKGFGNAINVTLGLPVIRTSVDHGTALSIAGTGKANSDSLLLAIKTAAEMANNHAT